MPSILSTGLSDKLSKISAADMAAAQIWAENDPYAKAGLFENVTLTQWNRVIG